jgi:hypothetical protein
LFLFQIIYIVFIYIPIAFGFYQIKNPKQKKIFFVEEKYINKEMRNYTTIFFSVEFKSLFFLKKLLYIKKTEKFLHHKIIYLDINLHLNIHTQLLVSVKALYIYIYIILNLFY